ncbi:MAG TPA: hypothetical protein VMD91_08040 [Candidatus Sulfotelmatobacter sp.]|nr:hypothetical protein [Candidatus Sulfotelmatobacter sp.]
MDYDEYFTSLDSLLRAKSTHADQIEGPDVVGLICRWAAGDRSLVVLPMEGTNVMLYTVMRFGELVPVARGNGKLELGGEDICERLAELLDAGFDE